MPQHGKRTVDMQCQSASSTIFWCILFNAERAMLPGGIEATTISVLEVEFGQDVGSASLAVSATFMVGAVLVTCAMWLQHNAYLSDEQILRCSLLGCLLGCVMLCPFHTMSLPRQVAVILLADTLAFSFGHVSDGIISGVLYRCAAKCGWEENAVFSRFAATSCARAVAPLFARYVLSEGGRGVYAFCTCLFLLLSSLKWLTGPLPDP
mmetsp:Transcript_63681/g.177106  ORF Transcript_63681/g.177106 Transcript_63681/m.177106 type:complete len:208 (-) Transcript_63681:16-639(-)